MSFCIFSVDHYIVCPSSIYGIWLITPFGFFELFMFSVTDMSRRGRSGKNLNDVYHVSDHMSWTFLSMNMEILRLWNWNNLMLNCCVFYDQSDWLKKVIAGHIYRDQTILRRSDNPTNILKYNVWNDNVLLYILYA